MAISACRSPALRRQSSSCSAWSVLDTMIASRLVATARASRQSIPSESASGKNPALTSGSRSSRPGSRNSTRTNSRPPDGSVVYCCRLVMLAPCPAR